MRYLVTLVFGLALSVAFVACGGGEEAVCAEPAGDATGVWEMTATPIEDTCDGEPGAPYTFWVTIMQEGNSLTAQTPEGTMTGTICGDQVRMSGSSVNLELTVSADGNSVEGSDTWTWTDGVQSCGGSESLSGTRGVTPIYDPCSNVENCVHSANLCEELRVDFSGFTYVNAICTLTCETEGAISPDCPRAWVGLLGSCYPSSVAGGIVDAAICFEPCYVDADCHVGFHCLGAASLCGADPTCPIDENDAICVPGPS